LNQETILFDFRCPQIDNNHAINRSANVFTRFPVFYGWIIVTVAFVTVAIAVNARTAFSLLFRLSLMNSNGIESLLQGLSQLDLLRPVFLYPL